MPQQGHRGPCGRMPDLMSTTSLTGGAGDASSPAAAVDKAHPGAVRSALTHAGALREEGLRGF